MLIRHRDRISEVVDIVKGTFCFNPKDARAGPPAAAPWELLSHSGRPPRPATAGHGRPSTSNHTHNLQSQPRGNHFVQDFQAL